MTESLWKICDQIGIHLPHSKLAIPGLQIQRAAYCATGTWPKHSDRQVWKECRLISDWARSCKNVYCAMCEQQRCRSACTSAQSDDQHLCCSLLTYVDSMICTHAVSKSFKILASFWAEQAGLNRTCSKIPKDRVLCDVAQTALSDQGLHCLAFFLNLFI